MEENITMVDITDEDLIDYSTDEDSSSDDSEEDRIIGVDLGLLGPCGFSRITCCAILSNADAYTDDAYPWDRQTAIWTIYRNWIWNLLVDEGHLNPYGERATYIKIYHRTISPTLENLNGMKESLSGIIRTSSI